jgi:uncharacterized protein (TIGR03086 family)
MDPRPLFLRTVDQLEKLLQAVTPESLTEPTPCREYDLRALLSHTVGAVHRIAYAGEGGRALDVLPQVDRVADDDWPPAVARARARAAAAWADDSTLDRTTEMPFGTVPGRAALSVYVMEIAAHTWDITQTLRLPASALDPELAEYALTVAHRVLLPENRGPEVPFGPVKKVAQDADPYTRLAAWLGREG